MRELLSQNKRYVVGAVAVLLLLSLYFFRLPFMNIDATEAIPTSAGIVVEIPDIQQCKKQLDTTAYRDALSQMTLSEKCASDLTNLHRIFDESILPKNMNLLAAASESNSQSIDFLYIVDSKWRKIHIRSLLEKLHGVKVSAYNFQGHEVLNVMLWNNFAFSFSTYHNLIIGARYATLVEDALLAIDQKNSIANSRKFTKLHDDLKGKYDMSIYFNIDAMPKMLSSFLTPDKKQELTNLSKSMAWLGSGLTFSKEGIALKGGISMSRDNAFNNALSKDLFHNRKDIAQVLPTNTAMMTWVGTGDFQHFNSLVGGNYLFNYYLAPWLGEEFAYFMMEPYSAETTSEIYLAFKIQDKKKALEKMQALEEKVGLLQNYDYNTFKIKQLANDDLLEGAIGERAKAMQKPYFVYAGDYMVFCSSRAGIEVFIDKYMVGQTLVNDVAYQSFEEQQTDKTNLFFYLNSTYLSEMLQKSFQEEVSEQLTYQFEQVSQLNLLGVNLRAYSGGFDFTGKIKWNIKKKTKTNIASVAWKTLLDADAVIAPAVVLNPLTEDTEIFIQDIQNQIYIINGSGEITKKRKIDGKILSEVKQVEYFGNGKLYYIFNTENKVYILDDKGNDAQNFPILIQSPATSGMLVVDFDRSKNYQYFIPTKNGNIYGFEKNGKPLAGWNPRMGVGAISVPIRHFQTEGKDFIVAINQAKKIMAFRRNGELRFSLDAASSVLSPAGFQGTPPERIVVSDAAGIVQNINFAGDDFKMALKTGTGNEHKFLYTDVLGDNKNEYIVLNNNVLACHGYDGETFKPFFTYKFQDKIDEVFPVTFPNRSKKYIGLVCKASAHIFLMDGTGKIYKEFPLGGTTSFQLCNFFGEDVNTLVVANGTSVYTYKLKEIGVPSITKPYKIVPKDTAKSLLKNTPKIIAKPVVPVPTPAPKSTVPPKAVPIPPKQVPKVAPKTIVKPVPNN